MNLATIGPFVISARAVPQGLRWEGIFSVRRFDERFRQPVEMVGEVRTPDTYLTQEQAASQAFSDAQVFATRRI